MFSLAEEAEAGNCPLKSYSAQASGEIVVFYNDSTLVVSYVDADGDWKATPYTVLPSSVAWTDDTHAVGTASNSAEWGMGIDSSGVIQTFGSNNVTTSVPTANGPYSSPRAGSTGKFSALNVNGTPENWGNTNNGWHTSEPTTTGLTALDVGYDVGCAVSDTLSLGVVCWGGSDPQGLISSASRPTSGTFQSVSVGRYAVVAVDTNGNTVGWGPAASSSAFLANRPMTGVESVDLGEFGERIGVAWMQDGTAVIWQDPTKIQQGALKSAPGFTAYGSGSLRSYVPRGPNGNITFRSQPNVSIYGNNLVTTVAAVVDDGKGLVDDGIGPYDFGDAIYWTGIARLLGSPATNKFQPIFADACD